MSDDTFAVYDILLALQDELDEEGVSAVINALVDQYTMRGKSQHASWEKTVIFLMDIPSHLNAILSVCLFRNAEPVNREDVSPPPPPPTQPQRRETRATRH